MPPKDQLPPAEEQIVKNDSFEAELFWHKNGRTILLVAGIVIVAVVAAGLWLWKTSGDNAASATLLAQAKDAPAWQAIIDQYPKTDAAADAYILLAETQRQSGDIAASSKTYDSFLSAFPKSSLTGTARLGLAANLELQGKTNDAMAALQELQAQDSNSFAAPFASLLEGRMLMQQGKFAEARKVLRTLVQSYSASPAANFGASLLRQIDALVPADAPKTDAVKPPVPQ